MPSSSKKQHNFMEAIAHSPSFAKKVGVPQSVGKDFSAADKGRKFSKGGFMAKDKEREDFDADIATAKRALYKQPGEAAIYSRERGLGPGMARRRLEERGVDIPGLVANEPTDSDMKKGGKVKKMAGGGMAKSDMKEDMKMDKMQDKAMIKKAFKQHDAQEHKGGKGTSLKLAGGGTFRSSANGIAQRGKTKGTMVKMNMGGKTC
jgi:hypothetical protein